jgi:hypothetical protein
LNEELPYSRSPVVAPDGVYVLALKQKLPSELQPFEVVRERVTRDFRQEEAAQMARTEAEKFQQSLTNALAQGKTLEAAAQEAKVTPIALPPFSASSRTVPRADLPVNFGQLREVAAGLASGKSGFIPSEQGGAVVFLKQRNPVAEERLKSELPTFANQIREQRQALMFGDWMQRQVMASLKLPQGQARQ